MGCGRMKRFFRHFCFAAALAAVAVVVANAQAKITVADLVTFITSSIKMKQDDVKVAGTSSRIKLKR